MPKFAGVRPKPTEKLQKKKRPAREKKPAIPDKAKAQLIKDANNLRKLKAQVQKMKLGIALLEGKFSEVNRNYSTLQLFEEMANAELDYISEIKTGKKANEPILKFEKAVEEFREDVIKKQRFISRSISTKLESLYQTVLEIKDTNMNKYNPKTREKIMTKVVNAANNYQLLKSKFPQLNFNGPKGVDYRFEEIKKIIESKNVYNR